MMYVEKIKTFFHNFKIKTLVFALAMLVVFSTTSEAEEYHLVLPVDASQSDMEVAAFIKKKFPTLEYLDISVATQGTELQVGPLESESLAQALAAEFSEEGFHSVVAPTSQLREARLQADTLSGSETEVSAPVTSQVVQESTVGSEETSGLKILPSPKITEGDGPLDALAVENADSSTLDAPEIETAVAEPSASESVQEARMDGEEVLRLEPPSTLEGAEGEEPLDALAFEDLDAPALDAEAVAQGVSLGQATFSAADVFADENYLLLQLGIGNVILAKDIAAYAAGATTYFPLAVFFRNVEFAIGIDSDLESATGWFIDKKRTFDLDRREGTVTIEGKELVLGELDVVDDGYELYASTHALDKWFPVRIEVSQNDLTATIIPEEKLPVQKTLARRTGETEQEKDGYRISNEMRDLEYSFFEPSALKITATEKYTKQKSKDGTFSDNIIADYSGDFAYFNTNVYATGALDTDEDHVDSLRFIAKRISPESELLGPLQASEIHLGDVNTVNFIGKGTGGGQQRGAYITNRPLTRSTRYDSTTLSGNSLPDWDVELYQDGRLIDSKEVGPDGQYEFNDIELFYGQNIFVIKQFGPHGEQEQEEKRINVTRNNIPVGDLRYDLSVTQQNSKTLEVTESSRTQDSGNIATAFKADYGLSPLSYLTFGLESETIKNIRHNYLHLGGTHSFTDRANLHIEGQADSNGGQMAQGVLQVGFSPFSLSLTHKEHFDNFEAPTIRTSSASIAPNIGLPWEEASLSTSFSGTLIETQTSTSKAFGNNLTLRLFKNIYMSNQLSSSSGGKGDDFFKSMSGRASMRALYPNDDDSLWGRIEVSGSVEYDVKPLDHVKAYEFNFFDKWGLTDNVSIFAQYSHKRQSLHSSTSNTYGGGFFVKMGELSITPSISYSDTGVIQAGAQFSLPLAINPRDMSPQYEDRSPTTSGGVSALVFLDKNYNYIFDDDDEALENITVNALQLGRKELTDSSGMALIHGLPPNLPVDVDIENGKDWESTWVVRSKGEAIYPRPGKTYLLDFPVQIVSEFDGMVMAIEGGDVRPYPSVPLELVRQDGEVVAETASEHDGFYLFERVIPGKYFIRPKEDFLQSRDLFALPSEMVKATKKGIYLSYLNVYMSSNKRDLIMSQASKFSEFSEELSVARRFSSYEEAKEAGGMLSKAQLSGNETTTLSEAQPSGERAPQAFVHVESYKDLELAEKAIASLHERHSILSGYEIIALRNDVIGKGVYYRVVISAPTVEDARKLEAHFKTIGKYANVINM